MYLYSPSPYQNLNSKVGHDRGGWLGFLVIIPDPIRAVTWLIRGGHTLLLFPCPPTVPHCHLQGWMGSAITETPGPCQATGKREERIKLWKHHRDSVLHIIFCRLEIICKYVLKSQIYLVNNSTYLCIYFTSSLSPNSTTIRIFKRLNIDTWQSSPSLCQIYSHCAHLTHTSPAPGYIPFKSPVYPSDTTWDFMNMI